MHDIRDILPFSLLLLINLVGLYCKLDCILNFLCVAHGLYVLKKLINHSGDGFAGGLAIQGPYIKTSIKGPSLFVAGRRVPSKATMSTTQSSPARSINQNLPSYLANFLIESSIIVCF